MRAAVLLRHALTKNVLDVILAQSRLEFALTGRVDTLTNDNRLRPNLHGLRERGDHRAALGYRRSERYFAALFDGQPQMLRCSAAAAAKRLHAHACNFFHQVRKLSRRDIEYRLAVFAARQTGIRVDDDRQ